MPDILDIDAFLDRGRGLPVLDVRTPAEFENGHIPGAVNVPLFSNEERAEVGTAYVRQGRRVAVSLGLARVGPKLEALSQRLIDLADRSPGGLLIHCWRGGMRSGSVAWLAEMLGIPAFTLAGGYKAFRRKVLTSFGQPRRVRVVAGLTGTGKTAVLRALAARGEQVIDLEAHARHKGSAFGDLGEEPQPRQEQFENELALAWLALDPEKPVWLEDESRMIGKRVLPAGVWDCKQAGEFEVIILPENERIARLREMYAGFPVHTLEVRVEAIRSRLGGLRAKEVFAALSEGKPDDACRIILTYYDRAYQKCIDAIPAERKRVHGFPILDPDAIAVSLLAPSHAVSHL